MPRSTKHTRQAYRRRETRTAGLTVYMTPTMRHAVEDVAVEDGLSAGDVIRVAIVEALRRRERERAATEPALVAEGMPQEVPR